VANPEQRLRLVAIALDQLRAALAREFDGVEQLIARRLRLLIPVAAELSSPSRESKGALDAVVRLRGNRTLEWAVRWLRRSHVHELDTGRAVRRREEGGASGSGDRAQTERARV